MPDPGTDALSPIAHEIIKAATYEKLVASSHTSAPSCQLLGPLSADQLLTVPIANRPAAMAMLAGLWLWHDGLSECHEIVQKSPKDLERAGLDLQLNHQQSREMTDTLSFWHAIMHRREGDFSNSKYWFARCADHPVLKSMGSYANDILHPLPADKSLLRLVRSGWDPDAFVDLAEAVHDRPEDARYRPAVALQKIEWRLLFNYCTRLAAGQ